MALDTFAEIKAAALRRAYEASDGNSDWDDDADDAMAEIWRELWAAHPWNDLVQDPPGSFVTSDDVTTLTLTIATAGTAVAGTLSAVHATSLAGFKIKPNGVTWHARITAHVAGTDALTLDAVPETVAAGTACTIFQDEYELASDLGLFVDGLWHEDGSFVRLVSEEELKDAYRGTPPAGDPDCFARLTRRKIRLSHYPTSVQRYEYPYTYEPADPSGATTLVIGAHLRPVYLHGVLAELFTMKVDKRSADERKRFLEGIERAVVYETRRRTGLGQIARRMRSGGYGN
jgi:hypothetical protein